MQNRFGKKVPDVRVILVVGILFAVVFLWKIWPRCASQAPCTCQSQVAGNLPVPTGRPLTAGNLEQEMPQFMSDMSFSLVLGSNNATSKVSTTRISAAGDRFFRREAPSNLEWGRKELFIKNQSDNWILNLFNKSGVHYESLSPQVMVKLPISFKPSDFKGELLLGDEVKFFGENNAQKSIEGKNVIYELKSSDSKLRLKVDLSSDKPLRIDVVNDSNPLMSYSVIYEAFERRVKFQPDLFQVPSGFFIRDWDLKAQKQEKYLGWSGEDPALLNYYLRPDPQALVAAFEKLPSTGIPEMRLPFIELAAAILKREPSVITPFVRLAKQSIPDLQIWAALALRGCRSEECLKVLRTNPFGFVDEGFKGFIAVADNVQDQSKQRANIRTSVDESLAHFIVFGDKDSLGKVITFLDSRIELSGEGSQAAVKPLSLDSAPPGIVGLIKQFAAADSTVKEYLRSRQEAKSRSAAEILNLLS